MKKLEYELNFIYDLTVRGEVSFTITFKCLHRQEYSSLDFQVNPSDGAYVY